MEDHETKEILLVEDDILIAHAEAKTIENQGYFVHLAYDPAMALKTVEENPQISLVMMDIDLECNVDGIELAEQILTIKDIPIVFLTSHNEEKYFSKVKRITRYGLISKDCCHNFLTSSLELAYELFEKNQLLAKSEYLLNEAQNLAHIGHWHWDIAVSKLAWSKEIFSIFGVDDLNFQVSVQNFENAIHPEDLESFLKKRQEMLDIGSQSEIEHRIVRPDGEIRYVVERAKALRNKVGIVEIVMGTVQDITERKLALQTIQEERERANDYLKIAATIILALDVHGKISLINERGCETLGLSEEKIVGKNWFEEFVPESVREKVKNIFLELIHGNIEEYEHVDQFTIIDAQGNEKLISWHNSLIKNSNGVIIGTLSSGIDITEKTKYELELKKTLQQNMDLLRELQHRAKNSFMMIHSMVQLAEISTTDVEVKSILKDVSARIRAVSELYDLLYSSGMVHEVDLDQYLEKVAISLIRFSEGIQFRKNLEHIVLSVKTAICVGIITAELITNSLKHAFISNQQGTIFLSLWKTDQLITVEVRDNGVGMPDEFDLYSSNSLGLKIVQTLIDQINGTFRIEKNEGTRCQLDFPIHL